MIELIRNIARFDALCCLNGDLPNRDELLSFPANLIIAADGAATKLIASGIVPDIIIGDLDSLDRDALPVDFPQDKIIYLPDQNSSDFEKIMNYCLQNNFRRILVIGFHGGDLDHTINNLSLFKKFADKLDLLIFDNGLLGFLRFKSFSFDSIPGEPVSLIPFPSARITTHNLKWELNDEVLELGIREGHGNIAMSDRIQIEINEGAVFCFLNVLKP